MTPRPSSDLVIADLARDLAYAADVLLDTQTDVEAYRVALQEALRLLAASLDLNQMKDRQNAHLRSQLRLVTGVTDDPHEAEDRQLADRSC